MRTKVRGAHKPLLPEVICQKPPSADPDGGSFETSSKLALLSGLSANKLGTAPPVLVSR